MRIFGYELSDEGCGDSACLVKKPKGMATNGGCRCIRADTPLSDALKIKRELDRLRGSKWL